jgi:hypothetical protein
MKDEALKLALEALKNGKRVRNAEGGTKYQPDLEDKALTAIKQALAAPVQEPVAWKWHQAPVKTSWGNDMVVADLAIDKDNTVSVYCERDQTAKVEAMFTPPAAQRQWVGLTNHDIEEMVEMYMGINPNLRLLMRDIEAKLKEKNT